VVFNKSEKKYVGGKINLKKIESKHYLILSPQIMSLKHIEGRIVIKVDMEKKNSHTFDNGTTIRLERQYNEFNRRITEPVNAEVISAEYIPVGAEVLIHHNCTHEVNRIYDHTPLSGETEASSVKYFAIPEDDCYAWRDSDGNLQPMKGFQFALRVFQPYKGVIQGIEPTLLKDVLYITTGELAGKVAHVLKASDYQIVFQGQNGREDNVIRLRHSDTEQLDREEVVAIDHTLTEKVNSGELLVGLSATTIQPPIENEITANTTNHT
jgi:hypothetical protein